MNMSHNLHKKIALLTCCIITSPTLTKDFNDQLIENAIWSSSIALTVGLIAYYCRQPSHNELKKLELLQNTALYTRDAALHAKEKAYIELPVTLLEREGNNLILEKRIRELDLANKEYTIQVHNFNTQSIQSIRNLLEECEQNQYREKKECENIKKLLDETCSLATEFTIECKKEIKRD